MRSNRSPSSQLYREFIASLSSEPLSGSTFTQVHPTSKQDRIANRVSETTTSARTYASIPRSKSNSAKQPHHATYTTPCFLFPSFFFLKTDNFLHLLHNCWSRQTTFFICLPSTSNTLYCRFDPSLGSFDCTAIHGLIRPMLTII